MTNLTHMTIDDAVDALKAKKFSAKELTEAHRARINAAMDWWWRPADMIALASAPLN